MGNSQGMHSRKSMLDHSSTSSMSPNTARCLSKPPTGLSLSAGPSPAHHPTGSVYKCPLLLTPKASPKISSDHVVPVAVSLDPGLNASNNNNNSSSQFLSVPSSQLFRRKRCNSDAVEYISRSPSPMRQNARPIYLTTATPTGSCGADSRGSPRNVDRTMSLDAHTITNKLKQLSGSGTASPKSPKINLKPFKEVDLNFRLFGRRFRKPSGELDVLSIKIPEQEPIEECSPVVPSYEVFEPLGSDLMEHELSAAEFRVRATTIGNGQVARLKRLGAERHREALQNNKKLGHTKKIPTVFRFVVNSKAEKNGGKKAMPPSNTGNSHEKSESNGTGSEPAKTHPTQVYIAGTMTGWKAVEMARPKGDSDFCAIIDCQEGDMFFKFCVDGEWMIDPSQEKVAGRQNIIANVLRVKKSDFAVMDALACDSFVVKSKKIIDLNLPQTWGQYRPRYNQPNKNARDSSSKSSSSSSGSAGEPPCLPPQLLNTQLNKNLFEHSDPVLLPEPTSHVMLNHLYAQSVKDNVLVMASTSRFRKKYCTVIFYKPI